MEVQKEINDALDRVESDIIRLNIDSPIDRWWRNKHNIAFNSAEHRAITILDQYAEWYEDWIHKDASEKIRKFNDDPYIIGEKNFLYKNDNNKELDTLSDEEFDNISLDD